MKLHSIEYSEHEGQTFSWQLDEFELSNINLIVGKNATGKSRILRVINGLARLLDGTIQSSALDTGKYKTVFKDIAGSTDRRAPDLQYSLSISDKKIVSEKLVSGEITKLDRGSEGRADLFFEKNNTSIDVQIPVMHLAASVRRDMTQHPFFEPLHAWANTVKFIDFSKIENHTHSSFEGKIPTSIAPSVPFDHNLHLIAKMGKERFGRAFEGPVISDMSQIGYEISEFGLTQERGIPLPLGLSLSLSHGAAPQTLYVKEKNIEKNIVQREMSNGMLRALGTLIYLSFTRLNKKRDCLLIDDIGEGLDFERASKLIAVMIKEAEKGFTQLILTTNDRFIMNGVPLKYWSVVQREKGKVSVFNEQNSPNSLLKYSTRTRGTLPGMFDFSLHPFAS